MIDAKDVAARLGIGRSTVYALAKSGDLQSYVFGSAVRFDPRAVDAS